MAENFESFVVKPTLIMALMAEKGTNNIRKIDFMFRDMHFWSIKLNGESVATVDHGSKDYKAILEADKQRGLIQHLMLGELPVLPGEEVSKLFHTLWSKAAGCENHDKNQWKELWGILRERGYDV